MALEKSAEIETGSRPIETDLGLPECPLSFGYRTGFGYTMFNHLTGGIVQKQSPQVKFRSAGCREVFKSGQNEGL